MTNILHVADIHINLKPNKKIDKKWQLNRFSSLFNQLIELENETDITVIAGDIFDSYPIMEEVTLFHDYVNRVKNPTIIIPGNHESTKRGSSFLETYEVNIDAINNKNVYLCTNNSRLKFHEISFQLFPYNQMEINNVPKYHENDILVTHIRGEIPPHITAEFDFEKLRDWKLILLGDIHVNMRYKDFPAYYPGSPLNTSFDRNDNKKYGVNIINFNNIDDYTVQFKDLQLPKLIRKTITVNEDLVKDVFNNVIYEVTGTIDELKNIDSTLIDKKIAKSPKQGSKLNINAASTIVDELSLYLDHIQVSEKDAIVNIFKQIYNGDTAVC